MLEKIADNVVAAEMGSGSTVKRLLFAIRRPVYVVLSVNLFCAFAQTVLQVVLGPVWLVLKVADFCTTIACLLWAGQLAYRNIKPSIVHASLAGPVLSFFSLFLVELASRLRYVSGDWEAPGRAAGTLLANKYFMSFTLSLGVYLITFPIAMGLAALGAAMVRRKHKGR